MNSFPLFVDWTSRDCLSIATAEEAVRPVRATRRASRRRTVQNPPQSLLILALSHASPPMAGLGCIPAGINDNSVHPGFRCATAFRRRAQGKKRLFVSRTLFRHDRHLRGCLLEDSGIGAAETARTRGGVPLPGRPRLRPLAAALLGGVISNRKPFRQHRPRNCPRLLRGPSHRCDEGPCSGSTIAPWCWRPPFRIGGGKSTMRSLQRGPLAA